MSEVELVEVETQAVLGTRGRGSYPMIGEMIGKVFGYAMQKGAQIAGPPVYVCHEMSAEEAERANREGNADLEVALPVAGEVEGTDDVWAYSLPGGRMAKIVHKGPYRECQKAYELLFAWVADSEMEISGPIKEVYLNDPGQVPEEEILTEIYAPVEKKTS